MACRAVRRTITAPIVRLVIGTHWIVRANGRALEGAVQDAGESWRGSNKATKGALCPSSCRINQDAASVGRAAGHTRQGINALLQRARWIAAVQRDFRHERM